MILIAKMPYVMATIFAVLAGIYGFLWALLQLTQDAREPPSIDSTIPFIEPLVKMGFRGFRYWASESRPPIHTLRLPGVRLYIVNSTSLIPAVHRKSRHISFGPVIVWMASTLMGVSDVGLEVASQDPFDDHGFAIGTAKTIHPTLAPGEMLDQLNRASIQVIAASLDLLRSKGSDAQVAMYKWVCQEAMIATTQGIYGPRNPFKDQAFRQAWFDYEPGLVPLMINVLPQLTARKYTKARRTLAAGFEEYFTGGGHSDVATSSFTKERFRFLTGRGMPIRDVAAMEAAVSIGLLSNTMPATFWFLLHAYSDPYMLEDCRNELSQAVHETGGVCVIDLAFVKTSCPILLSAFKEVLRFHGMGMSTRIIGEDQMLEDQYLLKKGSILLIPATVQHSLRSVWGEDVDRFSYKRFLSDDTSKKIASRNLIAFRGFGGGSSLCPGRHFAATEILTFASLMLLQFDVEPVKGMWSMPSVEKTNLGISVHQPDYDIEVAIRPRSDKRWVVNFTGSDKVMGVSAEDLENQ
ncbi:cytochrome P450 [Xylaria scruposa]|nr:cytochrome P450 [Xylaria scruposa]